MVWRKIALEAKGGAEFEGYVARDGLKASISGVVDELPVHNQNHFPTRSWHPPQDTVQSYAVGHIVVLDEILPIPRIGECYVGAERHQPRGKRAIGQFDIAYLISGRKLKMLIRTPSQ